MPSTHKRSFAAEELARRRSKKPTAVFVLGAVIILLVIVGSVLYFRYGVRKEPMLEVSPLETPAGQPEIKIAVLAFDDMSPEKDQEWFCDGIADEIINSLARVEGIQPISRKSSFTFKGKDVDIREIGRLLDVQAVLEGSVRKAGDDLRITAQLIRVSDQTHLWTNTYERKLPEIFAIQEDIALSIARELKGTLREQEQRALIRRYTNDVETYQLMLQGLDNMYKLRFKEARECYQMAIKRDPQCAYAYSSLSFWEAYYGNYEYAKQLVEKTLELDDTLYGVYLTIAMIKERESDYSATENAYKQTLTYNPGDEGAHFLYAQFLRRMGRYREALDESLRSMELNPLYPFTYGLTIGIYNNLDMFEDALRVYERGSVLFPDNDYIMMHMGRFYDKRGEYGKAHELFEGMSASDLFLHSSSLTHTACTYARMGDRAKAEKILDEMKQQKVDNSWQAFVYIALGEYDRAFELLETVDRLPTLICDFEYDPIRSDPRFKALLKKMNLPEN